jgi:outer membrane protein assembly factor BamB
MRHVPWNVLASDQRVFVSATHALALDAATGIELWSFTPDTTALAMAAVDDRAYYIGTDSRRVYALQVSDGRLLWWSEIAPVGAHPSFVTEIMVHGDTVYASVTEETSLTGHLKRGIIVALDRHTGAVFWRYVNEAVDRPHDAGRMTVAGRILLANDLNGGAFMGIDRFTGREVWRHIGPRQYLGARDFFRIMDGVAYIASNDTNAYGVDPTTGRVHWRSPLRGSANSSDVCGGHLFASNGALHKLRRSDGRVVANLFIDWDGTVGNEWVNSRVLSHGNRVYFVGNKAVYAVSGD